MGTKIGRNNKCPCGSGKKYKLCCLTAQLTHDESPPTSGRFRFEPGSYGGPGAFLPSIGCLEQWKPQQWRYHFVLVKLNDACVEEAEAVLEAEKDLRRAFDTGGSSAAEAGAYRLKALGYMRVDDFNIVG